MSVLSISAQQQVEERLLDEGLIDKNLLEKIKGKSESSGEPIFSLLVNEGHISNELLTKFISKINNIPYVNLLEARVDPEVLDLLPQDVAERYMAVPLGEMQSKLAVAMLDADNIQAVDFLSNKIGRPLKVYTASEEGIRHILKQYGQRISNIVTEMASNFESVDLAKNTNQIEDEKPQKKIKNIDENVSDSPISKAISSILEFAVRNRASDIHIEPREKDLAVRARVDGVLREIMILPKSTEPPIISRIKILSNLKIDEHRIPQDGQFSIRVAEKDVDLRIAISPVVWGEQVVIRLLDKSSTSLHLEDMGYAGRSLKTIRNGLERSNGMILTSGPTGSGKSTSMYALIKEIKNDSINIITLEDPVEYKIEGINQIQVNSSVGLTFANGLRSVLRQDPDVVMVGEIRDKETAQLAIQAALTGHLVFSTLHTNSAAGILPRLLDMEIEPFLIASTVHTVIGQRLVRRIDPKSRKSYESSHPETEAIQKSIGGLLPDKQDAVADVSKNLGYKDLPLSSQNAYTLYKGTDSPEAPGGYSGRVGIYEVFEVTEKIQDHILKRSPSSEIEASAVKEGMVTMRQDGYLKALNGLTTLSEVNRVATVEGG